MNSENLFFTKHKESGVKMKTYYILCCFAILIRVNSGGDTNLSETQLSPEQMQEVEKKLSEQIIAILEHYKQEDPVGLPNVPVPDPMAIPDMTKSFSLMTINFRNASLYGLSKFRIRHVFADVKEMELSIGLEIDQLDVRGNYTASYIFSRPKGGFNIKLLHVYVQGLAKLEVSRSGQLQAQEINMDISFQKIDINFQNLGLVGSMFQGIINSVGAFMFDSVKPFILKEVNVNIRGDLNRNIAEIPQRFPNSISPLDMAIAEGRKKVRQMGYDPIKVAHTSLIENKAFTLKLVEVWVRGLSSFYRIGNFTVSMSKNIVHLGVYIGTQNLEGTGTWEISLGGVFTYSGYTSFSIQYLRVLANASQALDVRKRPSLDVLDLTLGNIQLRMDGLGTLDYLLEATANILPNILRNQILNFLEEPIRQRIQEILEQTDVEALVEDYLPTLDENMQSVNNIEEEQE